MLFQLLLLGTHSIPWAYSFYLIISIQTVTQQPVHDADNEGGDDVESGGGLESGHQAPTPSPHVDCEEDPHRAEHFRTPAPPLLFYSAPAQQALGPT